MNNVLSGVTIQRLLLPTLVLTSSITVYASELDISSTNATTQAGDTSFSVGERNCGVRADEMSSFSQFIVNYQRFDDLLSQ